MNGRPAMGIEIRIAMLLVVLAMVGLTACSDDDPATTPPEPDLVMEPKITLELADLNIDVGDSTQLSIKVEGLPETIFGLGVQIDFNPLVIVFDEESSYTPSEIFGSDTITLFQVQDGTMHLSLSGTAVNEKGYFEGDLGSVVLHGAGPGVCGLLVDPGELWFVDSEGEPVPFQGLEIISGLLVVE